MKPINNESYKYVRGRGWFKESESIEAKQMAKELLEEESKAKQKESEIVNMQDRIKIEDLKDFDTWKAWKNGNLQLEPLWTEEEVSRLLDTQRGNSYVAVYDKTHDVDLASLASSAPEPGQWKERK
jgi:hypothetical protein